MGKQTVIIDYRKMQENELLTFSSNVAAKLLNNENFKFEANLLPDFKTAIADYSSKLTAAEQGTSHDVAQKNVAKEVVQDYLNEIGTIVNLQSKGDNIVLQSSGLILAKEPKKVGILPKPTNFKVVSGVNSGDFLLTVDSNTTATMYNFYSAPVPAPADIREWRLTPSTTRKKNVGGFVPGKQYELKCAYQGSEETLVYSESVIIYAQ